MVTSCTTDVSGTVLRANERGLVLSGRDGWLNVSKWATVVMPAEGARVRVGLDKAGYVRSIEAHSEPVLPIGDKPERPQGAPVDRDAHIMRQAVLNTATAILSSGDRVVDAGEALRLAERLESWVLR